MESFLSFSSRSELLEYNADKTWEQHGTAIINKIKNSRDDHPVITHLKSVIKTHGENASGEVQHHFLSHLEQVDPTKNKEYVPHLARLYRNDGVNRFEDLGARATPALKTFHDLKNRKIIPAEHRDIGRIKHLNDLESLVDQHADKTSKNQEEQNIKKDVHVHHDDEHVSVIETKTHKANMLYGKNTKWCTTTEDPYYFNMYHEKGALLQWLPKKPQYPGEKYQTHESTSQFMNEKDSSVGRAGVLKRFPSVNYDNIQSSILKKDIDEAHDMSGSPSDQFKRGVNIVTKHPHIMSTAAKIHSDPRIGQLQNEYRDAANHQSKINDLSHRQIGMLVGARLIKSQSQQRDLVNKTMQHGYDHERLHEENLNVLNGHEAKVDYANAVLKHNPDSDVAKIAVGKMVYPSHSYNASDSANEHNEKTARFIMKHVSDKSLQYASPDTIDKVAGIINKYASDDELKSIKHDRVRESAINKREIHKLTNDGSPLTYDDTKTKSFSVLTALYHAINTSPEGKNTELNKNAIVAAVHDHLKSPDAIENIPKGSINLDAARSLAHTAVARHVVHNVEDHSIDELHNIGKNLNILRRAKSSHLNAALRSDDDVLGMHEKAITSHSDFHINQIKLHDSPHLANYVYEHGTDADRAKIFHTTYTKIRGLDAHANYQDSRLVNYLKPQHQDHFIKNNNVFKTMPNYSDGEGPSPDFTAQRTPLYAIPKLAGEGGAEMVSQHFNELTPELQNHHVKNISGYIDSVDSPNVSSKVVSQIRKNPGHLGRFLLKTAKLTNAHPDLVKEYFKHYEARAGGNNKILDQQNLQRPMPRPIIKAVHDPDIKNSIIKHANSPEYLSKNIKHATSIDALSGHILSDDNNRARIAVRRAHEMAQAGDTESQNFFKSNKGKLMSNSSRIVRETAKGY